MGNLFTEEVGKLLTRLLGNYLTVALGKVLDIYNKSFEMTLRYAHLSPDHKKAALDTLGKRLARNLNGQHGETREKYPGQLTVLE